MNKPLSSNALSRLAAASLKDPEAAAKALRRRRELMALRNSCNRLADFVKAAWFILEPETELKWDWVLDALCSHLEAVTRGDITRLLINVPPGTMKSLLVAVFWPAWEWGPMRMTSLRYLSASYKEGHALRDARRMKNLVESDWYRELWGSQVVIERGGDGDFENSVKGWRKARPIGSLTGDRGDRLILDDPHSTSMADSEASRNKTTRTFMESLPTRLNDPKSSAIVVIMQRLHQDDISGLILRSNNSYVHLCLPMRFEADSPCSTVIGFEDPRKTEGELLFPARWDEKTLDELECDMGPYAVAGQHQQRPTPRDGGLYKRSCFEIIDAVPTAYNIARAWDLAATRPSGTNDPDWTVGLKGQRQPDGTIIITDMVRMRGGAGEVTETFVRVSENDGYSTRILLPQDPGGSGKAHADYLLGRVRHRNARALPVTGDKFSRAMPPAADAHRGIIKIAKGAWNEAFLEEICSFPNGRHDDIVDALSDLHLELTRFDVYDLSGVSDRSSNGL